MPIMVQEIFNRTTAPDMYVALEPAWNVFYSLSVLSQVEELSGTSEWAERTAASLTPEQLRRNMIIMDGLYFAVIPEHSGGSFPDYIRRLESENPERLRERLLATYESLTCRPEAVAEGPLISPEVALSSPDKYLAYLGQRFPPEHIKPEIEMEAYKLLLDPPAMQDLVVSHFKEMWAGYLSEEWDRVRPTLEKVVSALRQVDLAGIDRMEAIRLITGRDLPNHGWSTKIKTARQIIFIPHPHTGPYLGKMVWKNKLGLFFSPRLPAGSTVSVPELDRSEIIIRLSALTDDNRLRILRLLAERGEMSSQDIIKVLDLSQSAASRHLKQLSANGYLSERWCDGAKCFDLNPERIEETLESVRRFLLGE